MVSLRGPYLSISDMDRGIKHTFRKFADDTKLSGVADTSEGLSVLLW